MITNHTTLCFGFVENNVDPLKIGRVQVRLIGYHTNDENKIPSENLPWCQSIVPPNLDVVKPPAIGSQVICISLDETFQNILVLGIINGISDDTEEPDTPRVARNENIDETIVQTKSDNRFTGEFEEPDSYSSYGTIYPKNFVFTTESGNIIEIDDTDGKERIQIYHKSGSFFEMLPDGAIITKSKGSSYDISNGSKNISASSTTIDCPSVYIDGNLSVSSGATGSFTSTSGQVITVQNGIVTNIV